STFSMSAIVRAPPIAAEGVFGGRSRSLRRRSVEATPRALARGSPPRQVNRRNHDAPVPDEVSRESCANDARRRVVLRPRGGMRRLGRRAGTGDAPLPFGSPALI